MYKQIILFGAGQKGREALDFFGKEIVYCFVDNDMLKQGTWLEGKKIISYSDLLELKRRPGFDIEFELVITVDKSPWATLAVSEQLRKTEIDDFSLFRDISRRYDSGKKFVERDRTEYPFEQETLLKIYSYQYEYLKRHTDVSMLTPATGLLREQQLRMAESAHEFFEKISELKPCYWIMAGTLMGAVRHGGFIPWDDDMDFCMMASDLQRVMAYLDEVSDCFRFYTESYRSGNNRTDCQGFKAGQLYGVWHFGWLNVFRYSGYRDIFKNDFVTDIMPVHYYGGDEQAYRADVERYKQIRLQDLSAADEEYARELMDIKKYPKQSNKLAWGIDAASGSWYFHRDDNKDFSGKIWDENMIFPLSDVMFEKFNFPAPCKKEDYIKQEYGDMLSWPLRVGAMVHDKNKLFYEKY